MDNLQEQNKRLEQELAERQWVEAELRRSEARNQAMINAIPDFMFRLNRAGEFLDFRASHPEDLYVSPEEFMGKTVRTTLPPDIAELIMAHIDQALQSNMMQVFEYQLGAPLTMQYFETRLVISGEEEVLAIVRNVTDRKQTEMALQQANTELSQRVEELSTLNLIGQTLATVTDLRAALRIVAAATTRLFYAQDTTIALLDPSCSGLILAAHFNYTSGASNITDCALPLAKVPFLEPMMENKQPLVVSEPQNLPFSCLAQTHQPDPSRGYLLHLPLLARNEVIGIVSIATDQERHSFTQTEISLAETIASQIGSAIKMARLLEEERQQRQIAEIQNKELDAFAHTVAHDLKNPLGLIVEYVDYLIDQAVEINRDELEEVLRKVGTAAMQSINIVEELLLLAGVRQREVPLRPLDMDDIVTQAQGRLAPMIKTYNAVITTPVSWPVALGYGPWVEEVWVNYLSNGLKYGGQPPCLELGATVQEDGMIRFWVQDNGVGLTPEAQVSLFTEFTRLSEVNIGGYGLGLSIVRRIIEKLNGQVGVKSQVGHGSLFYFTLPASI